MAAEYTVKDNDFSEYDTDKWMTLDRVDRNNTHYYTNCRCPKCGGTGYIRGYEHVEGGICFLCGGSGSHGSKVIVRTEEYAKKLQEARLERARKTAGERNNKFLDEQGFNHEGETWVAMGNTYQIKEQLKAAGAKYNDLFGWHFNHDTADFPVVKVTINDEIEGLVPVFDGQSSDWVEGTFKIGCYAIDGTLSFEDWDSIHRYVQSLREKWVVDHAPKTEYFGEIKDKVELEVTCSHIGGYESAWGYTQVFTFLDSQGHNFVWKTGSYVEIHEKDTLKIKGTIKAHTEYKGIKQTELTRCKII